MQKEPVFLAMTGPKMGPGSIVTNSKTETGPLRRGQVMTH